MYESCESVYVMKEEQESRTGMMLDFSWMIQEKSYVQITRSMLTIKFMSAICCITDCRKLNTDFINNIHKKSEHTIINTF